MSEPAPPDTQVAEESSSRSRMLNASAWMAAGTVVSRLSGFVRAGLLAAALGVNSHSELFTVANTVPNMLYILLAGGVFNAVLVPQLVRAMKHDADGGEAYANRIITLAGLFLLGVSALLVLGAPLLMQVFLDSGYDGAMRSSAVDLARYCLPQVFFYGMFVLIGQVLNARGRFGPMMWAPIANNVISVLVLVAYLFSFGAAHGAERFGPFSSGREALLGIGSTLGIAVQCAILVPYLRAAGFRYRPRFDFRGTGLGHTFRLGVWTVLFVVVNQISYTVVVRLAAAGAADGGSGNTVYATAFLVVMVPHSVVTVSLATAALPQLSQSAADGDGRRLARTLMSVVRNALVVLLPFGALLPLVAPDISRVLLHGAAGSRADLALFTPALAAFAPGVVLFTVHYLLLRGFYALELTRAVFFNQCWVAATNIAAAITLVHLVDDDHTAPALAGAYALAYLVGAVLSFVVLRRHTGGLEGHRLTRFVVRLGLATLVATGVAGALAAVLTHLTPHPGWPQALVEGAVIGLVDLAIVVGLARRMRITEVTDLIDALTRRLRRR